MSTIMRGDTIRHMLPLDQDENYQDCEVLERREVPELPPEATVAKANPRTVRYDRGLESWFVSPTDKANIRAYRKRRPQAEVDAGAFLLSEAYHDQKGPL